MFDPRSGSTPSRLLVWTPSLETSIVFLRSYVVAFASLFDFLRTASSLISNVVNKYAPLNDIVFLARSEISGFGVDRRSIFFSCREVTPRKHFPSTPGQWPRKRQSSQSLQSHRNQSHHRPSRNAEQGRTSLQLLQMARRLRWLRNREH